MYMGEGKRFSKSIFPIFYFILVAAVQHERGPRNSTIRRQVAMYLKEQSELGLFAANPFRPPYINAMMGVPPEPSEAALTAVSTSVSSPLEPAPMYPLTSQLANRMICHPTPKVEHIYLIITFTGRTDSKNKNIRISLLPTFRID